MGLLKLYRDAVVKRSKVVGKTETGRIIKNGNNRCLVTRHLSSEKGVYGSGVTAESYYTEYICDRLSFKAVNQRGVSKDLNFDFFYITYEGDSASRVPPAIAYFGRETTFPVNGGIVFGNAFINNINSIRYQVRKNSKVSYFLDKFVIVTPEERQAYREYAKQQDAEMKWKKQKL